MPILDGLLKSYTGLRGFAPKLADKVGEIQIPTLVFWGELDVLFDPSNAEHLNNVLPNSELHILPEAGHFSWSDQPELFASMVIDWVNKNS